MEISINLAEKACKLCCVDNGVLAIHFPSYVFRADNFVAPEWPEHVKYYCPNCEFLWAETFEKMTLSEYGQCYVNANYINQRMPAEERMKRAPLLLRELATLTGGERFIDYGVGYNVPYIYELRGRGVDLWGCDISEGVPYSRFIKYIPDKDLPSGTFDGLYSIDVAEHLSDILNDYLYMKELLRPGGYILHNTYWLHDMWKPGKGLPVDPMLRNPWHVSVCSESAMKVISEKTGLEFIRSLKVEVGPRTAYLLRKPGNSSNASGLWTKFRNKKTISVIDEHLKYVRKWYR